MTRKRFTDQEQLILRDNPHTLSVTTCTLSFTDEFRHLFCQELFNGATPREILEAHGYPASILGDKRIWGIGQYMRKKCQDCDNAEQAPVSLQSYQSPTRASAPQIRQLQTEVAFLRQEVEFLKKIFAARNSGK